MGALLIAAIQALPVYVVGVATKNKSALWVVTLIMIFVALSTGSDRYDVLDLVAIGIAFILAGASFEK